MHQLFMQILHRRQFYRIYAITKFKSQILSIGVCMVAWEPSNATNTIISSDLPWLSIWLGRISVDWMSFWTLNIPSHSRSDSFIRNSMLWIILLTFYWIFQIPCVLHLVFKLTPLLLIIAIMTNCRMRWLTVGLKFNIDLCALITFLASNWMFSIHWTLMKIFYFVFKTSK